MEKHLVFFTPAYKTIVTIPQAYTRILFENQHDYFESFGHSDEVLGEVYELFNDGSLELAMEHALTFFRDYVNYPQRRVFKDENGVLFYDVMDWEEAHKYYTDLNNRNTAEVLEITDRLTE